MSVDIPEGRAVEVEVEEVEEVAEVAEEAAPEEAPPPKRRGRPVGSKHKPKVAVVPLEPEPHPVITRAPKRAPRKTPPPPEPVIEPIPPDPSALILTVLREHQRQRAERKTAKYAAWFA